MKALFALIAVLALCRLPLQAQSDLPLAPWYQALATGQADSIPQWYAALPPAEQRTSAPLILLSKAYVQMRDLPRAISAIESVLHPDSMQVDLRAYLAGLYQSAQYTEGAFIQYSWLVTRVPEPPAYWFGLAEVSEQMEELESAAFYFKEARSRDLGNAQYSIRLAKALVNMDRADSALSALQVVAPAFENDRPFQLYYSELLYRNGQFAPMLEILERQPALPAHYRMIRGLAYMQVDSFALAQQILLDLPQKMLEYETVQANLARASLHLGDTLASLRYWNGALQAGISSFSSGYYIEKARLYLELDDLDQARIAVYKGLALERRPELIWLNARIAELQGRHPQAATAYREFVRTADTTQDLQIREAWGKIDSLEKF